MKPVCYIYGAGGADLTAGLADRLLSVEITDEAEDKSDRVSLRLDDRARWSDAAVMAIPLVGSVITVVLGYREGPTVTFGPYLLDDLGVTSPPREMTVTGKAAKMPKDFRTPRSESYHQQTLGEIMEKVAGRGGFSAVIDPELSGIVVRHADQQNESDMAFATRLASNHDAVARPAAGRLVVAKRGTGKTVGGAAMATLTLTEGQCADWSFQYSARDEAGEAAGLDGEGSSAQGAAGTAGNAEGLPFSGFPTGTGGAGAGKGGVRGFWNDVRTGERKEVKTGSAPYHDLRYSFHNEAEAQAGVDTFKNKSDRGKAAFSCTIGGNPTVQAESKLILSGFRPYMPKVWRIKSATHTYDGGGLVTAISAELFAEKQASVPRKVKGTTPAEDDKIDPDAPPKPVQGEYIIDLPE